jgi:hypothetical protein
MNCVNLIEQIEIEQILEEASAFFLRNEVNELATELFHTMPDIDIVTAYQISAIELLK